MLSRTLLSLSPSLRFLYNNVFSYHRTRFAIRSKSSEQPKAHYFVDEHVEEPPKGRRSVLEVILSGRHDSTKYIPFPGQKKTEPQRWSHIQYPPDQKQANIGRQPLATHPNQKNK